MARFRQTASYAGKGQKDLNLRVAELKKLGITIGKNPQCPHLFSRSEVLEAEKKLGLFWLGKQKIYASCVM